MRLSENDLISILLQIMLGVVLFTIDSIQVALILIFVEWFYLIFRYIAKGFCENMAYIAFLFCLFTFLMGGFLLHLGDEEYFVNYSYEAYMHISICLFLCLSFSSISYDFISRRNVTKDFRFEEIEKSKKTYKIRKSALWIFYAFSVFSVAVNGEKVLFVIKNSYLQYYMTYNSALPSAFFNLASISEFAFYVFLATMPRKKQCVKPIIWFLIVSAMSLGYGQRNGFVVSVLFVAIYYAIRHKLDGEKWISKKTVIATLIAIPFFISALYSFNYIRSDNDVKVSGVGNQIVAFFDEQSVSSQIIGYGYEYKDSIKQNEINYTISQLTNIVTQNTIVKKLFGTQGYTGQTVENALYGTNYGNAITYIVMPSNYLSGIGMGTSYVAEAYHDFGYFGVVFINIIYGGLLALFQKKRFSSLASKSRPYLLALLLFGMTNILYAPRSVTLGFISQTMTLTTLFAVCAIQLLSRFIKINDTFD